MRSFCWMLAVTGCRISEALSLTRMNIDFEAGHVIIQSLKKRGKRLFRAIPLPADYLQLLRRWFQAQPPGGERLWPWSRMTGYRRICEVMTAARISGSYATPKGLRHGFGVRAIQSNVPLTLVQKWLGHADIKTTAIYTSAMGPEEREIASRMWHGPNAGMRPVRQPAPASGEGSAPSARPVISLRARAAAPACDRGNSGAEINPLQHGIQPCGNAAHASLFYLAKNVCCHLLQNWIKCHKVYRCFSMAYPFLIGCYGVSGAS